MHSKTFWRDNHIKRQQTFAALKKMKKKIQSTATSFEYSSYTHHTATDQPTVMVKETCQKTPVFWRSSDA